MNHTPKIVFSTTLTTVSWGAFDNIKLVNKNIEAVVRKLKEQEGKDLIIFASSKLIQSFTNAGLIDEYRIVMHPVILGSGKQLFENISTRHNIALKSVKPYPGGAVLLEYLLTN